MTIIVRRTRTRQPQSPVGIDWSNPITRGLVAASIAGGAPNDITVYTNANGFTPGVSPVGQVANVAGASTQNFEYSGPNRVTDAPLTIITLAKFNAPAAQALFTAYESASSYHELYCTGGTGILRMLSDGSSAAAAAASATGVVVANEWAVFGGRVDSAASRSVWKNGVMLGSDTGNAGTTAATSNRWGVWNGTTERLTGAFAVRLLWNRALTDAEMAAISANPWQLFEPRSIFVPVSAGGGGSHDATGAMSAQSATVSGSAAAVATYTSSGAPTAQAATVAGTANHVTTHASSGVLEAQAATVAGSADHSAAGAFSATGALTAQVATVAGSAAHLTLHTATGALVADSATAAGSAVHYTLHTAAGDLVADAASISGSALHEGDGAEVAKPFTGAGRPRRTRQRVVVEIDGEDFIAESSEEAQAILDQAKEAAEEKAKVAVERATKARSRPTRKVLADARKSLELPEISAPGLDGYAEEISRQIEGIYQSAIQTIEVAALLRKRELAEEDDEDILMLIA